MDKYDRIHLKNCKLIKKRSELNFKSSSIKGEYYIPEKGKYVFYKANGCKEESNLDEDIRELLASEILDGIDINHANINLAYDDDNHERGCLSWNILKKGEKFLTGDFREKKSSNVEEFINNDIRSLKVNSEITEQFIEKRKKYLVSNIFINAFLNNTDIKINNMQIIYNLKNETYRNSPCIDLGASFSNVNKKTNIGNMTSKEILEELFEKYYEYMLDILRDIKQNLSIEKIDLIMNKLVYKQGFKKKYDIINTQLKNNLEFIKVLEKESKIKEVKKDFSDSIKNKGISIQDIELKVKDANVLVKDRAVHKLKNMSLREVKQGGGAK